MGVFDFTKQVVHILVNNISPLKSNPIGGVPNSSDGLIFVKRRASDVRFLDNNTCFRRAPRRAKFTFLIFFFLFKFFKKVKIEQNLFFSAMLFREGTMNVWK